MPDVKRIATVGGTFAAIMGIGYFMQTTSAQNAEEAALQNMATPVRISDITLTSAPMAAPDTGVAAEIAVSGGDAVKVALNEPAAIASPAGEAAPSLSCDMSMTAEVVEGARVALTLSAPCLPNERLTMHHNGMMFSEVTNHDGTLTVTVPALAKMSVFIASFANGEGAVASTEVAELKNYDRTLVQSDAQSAVSLHAMEYGATYGEVGHVWAETPRGAVSGGFLDLMGNPALENPLVAQVYSFPVHMAKQPGDVSLSVDVEVTGVNCGHDIEAQSIQTLGGAAPVVQNLDMSMPDCDAVGDFLVLKNFVNDLKVAHN